MDLTSTFKQSAPVRIMINIGACLDIPTGSYVVGRYGEHILNGGLGNLTGVVGIGNNFKSTVLHYLLLSALYKMRRARANTYDTEMNIQEWHLQAMAARIPEFNNEDLIANRRWTITDKTIYSGDEYYDIMKEYMQNKIKNAKSITEKTPFLNRDNSGYLEILTPTFNQIDSFSEFSTKDVIKMQDDNSLGDSGANMVSMRQGMQKNRFLMEVPALSGGSYNFILMTTHLGTEFVMDPHKPPPKKLQHLKGGVKIKGAPEKFTFATNTCWHCYNAAPLINQLTKSPEYPRSSDDDLTGDTDLNEVTVRLLRNKSGPTGMAVQLIVSQQEGVLPSLTEFHYIKGNDRFGLEGNDRNYNLVLLPEVKLSRTVVRGKIDSIPELRRVLNITAELCQMHDLWHHLDDVLCTTEELYNGLKEQGYDWKVLLNTRGYWVLDEENELPFLSTMDLVRMRKGKYIPYWMETPPAKALELYEKVNGKAWDKPKAF